jgi:hypothetical protein
MKNAKLKIKNGKPRRIQKRIIALSSSKFWISLL